MSARRLNSIIESMDYQALPGSELVIKGIADLRKGCETVESLVVSIGAERLRETGLTVPRETFPAPEHRLYEILSREGSDSAHSRYNALIRRLVSFERAAECVNRPT
jgi:hypothetical protein